MARLLPFLIVILSFKTMSQEPTILNADFANSYTSDKIMMNNYHVSYRNHRRNLLWPYAQNENNATDHEINFNYFDGHTNEFNFSGKRLTSTIGHQFSPNHQMDVEAGYHKLDKKISIVPWEIKYYHLHKLLYGNLFVGHDLAYRNLIQPAGYHDTLRSYYVRTNQTLTPYEHFKIPLRFSYEIFNDKNVKNDFSTDLLYGSSYPIWIWAGIGYQQLSHKNPRIGYWTPNKFRSVGPRFEITYPILDNLFLGWNINLNRIKEDGYSWGHGLYNAVNCKYGDRNKWQTSIGWTQIRSKQNNQKWKQNDLTISANKSF